jgi:CRP/FNR family transcriptional regulator, cyclic AMP receptor protein
MASDIQHFFLRHHELFKHLSEEDMRDVFNVARYRIAAKDDILYPLTEPGNYVYILHEGRIKITFRFDKESELISEILTEGEIFGQLLLSRAPKTDFEYAQVISETALISCFDTKRFESLLSSKPGVALNYSLMLAGKLSNMSRKYCLAFKDVRSRVVNYLKLYAFYEGSFNGNMVEVKTHRTHQEIADFIGSSRQTVSTIINRLVKEKKVIYEGRNKVIIPDIQRLDA